MAVLTKCVYLSQGHVLHVTTTRLCCKNVMPSTGVNVPSRPSLDALHDFCGREYCCELGHHSKGCFLDGLIGNNLAMQFQIMGSSRVRGKERTKTALIGLARGGVTTKMGHKTAHY